MASTKRTKVQRLRTRKERLLKLVRHPLKLATESFSSELACGGSRRCSFALFFARVMRFVRGDYFFRNFRRNEIVMRKFHRVASASLGHGNQFVRIAQHFREGNQRFHHHASAAQFAAAYFSAAPAEMAH